ncbi:uncharacterized protein LOC111390483 [Olea europaea var. sylvestris]|uniref:uncharacterized protein LOC111390483 n=1 Tax=Olea europaea var. sylvestris TaxID=158386 RepID=UPI000C1D0B0C|nr:uncharacterized protein LOC111390483 [Olea europaea var. sylvestris]
MEVAISGIFFTCSDSSFFIALATTLFCFIFSAVFILRYSRKPKLPSRPSELENSKPFDCTCVGEKSVNRSGQEMTPSLNSGNGGGGEIGEMTVERHTGVSMMEQLVPEITTHALSYLDYPSLCRLSMTNSHMRKAANDDNAWKALYHKVLFPKKV